MSEVVKNYERRTGFGIHCNVNQKILGDFVNRHVYHNVTSLFTELKESDCSIGREAQKLDNKTDFQQAARDEVEDVIDREFGEFLNASEMNRIADQIVDNLEENDDLENFCRERSVNIEQYELEVLQYFVVSKWLAEVLEGRGEVVDTNFYGLSIWGRQGAGQAIKLDSVIAELAIRQDILLSQRGCVHQEEVAA